MARLQSVQRLAHPARFASPSREFRVFTASNISQVPQFSGLPEATKREVAIVAKVLPFRVNNYVLDELIDWRAWESDPIFRLVFPNRDMLPSEDFHRLQTLSELSSDASSLASAVASIRAGLNPHPGGQATKNRPLVNGRTLPGIQHKYDDTVLFFPSQGQHCHSYCTFCFRWAQFVQGNHARFHESDVGVLLDYLRGKPGATDLLITGGDPMVMRTHDIEHYLEPILSDASVGHISNIRIGTKSLSYWPMRFTTDDDSADLLRLFERIVASGRHLTVMAHFNHSREMEPQATRQAIRRIIDTGAQIRSQGPILRTINDTAEEWRALWAEQVRLGIVPYYMFVERDTGPYKYFRVPLARCLDIYRGAISGLTGLAGTARGPVMSCETGKVQLLDTVGSGEHRAFLLKFLRARDPADSYKTFFAHYDEEAFWFDDLRPARSDWTFSSLS